MKIKSETEVLAEQVKNLREELEQVKKRLTYYINALQHEEELHSQTKIRHLAIYEGLTQERELLKAKITENNNATIS